MYANIVVLTYQSPDIPYFTYKIPEKLEKEIKVGQLVDVPFGKRNPMGVVLSLKNHPTSSVIPAKAGISTGSSNGQILDLVENDKKVVIRKITSIVLTQPILLPYQVRLAIWMSKYYLAPMVNCVEAMLPPLNAKRLETNAQINSVSRSLALSRVEVTSGHSQILVLVPTINHLPQTMAQFPKAKNPIVYTNELKPSEKFAAWMKILSGQIDYIFGSRSAVFAPCPKLAEIIIFDEHDGAYKDERSPHFDTLTVAEKIATLTGAKIKILDSSPKISTYFAHGTGSNHFRGDPEVQLRFHPRGGIDANTKIVNLKEEKLAGNFSPISDVLLEDLKKSKDSLLFLNKKKESGSLFCKSCKNHEFLENLPEVCPKCDSADFYFNVLNINSLAKETQKLTPQIKVSALSNHPTIQPSNLSRRQADHPTIDIATASIFYSQNIKKFDLVAHIQTDSLINRADFSSAEILYAQITNLKSLLKPTGVLVLQTHDPQNFVVQTAAAGNYQTYFEKQLKLRKALLYPPFALLVKLSLKGKDKQKLKQKANQLAADVQAQLSTLNSQLSTLIGPYQPFFFSKKSIYNIIIKYKLSAYWLKNREQAMKNLQFLRSSKDVQITVEPESLN